MRELHWIEIFKDKVSERLKEVLQEDMDWMTSLPIRERLNRLHEAEQARMRDIDVIRPADQKPISSK